MTLFFAGFATGAVVALFSAFCLHKAKTRAAQEQETTAEQARLNKEKRQREERQAELDRQWERMMAYTGKEQKA